MFLFFFGCFLKLFTHYDPLMNSFILNSENWGLGSFSFLGWEEILQRSLAWEHRVTWVTRNLKITQLKRKKSSSKPPLLFSMLIFQGYTTKTIQCFFRVLSARIEAVLSHCKSVNSMPYRLLWRLIWWQGIFRWFKRCPRCAVSKNRLLRKRFNPIFLGWWVEITDLGLEAFS